MTTRCRSLRSIVVRMAVFLLLGALVNVAVAWGCAISIRLTSEQFEGRYFSSSTKPAWLTDVFAYSGHRAVLILLYDDPRFPVIDENANIGMPVPETWRAELDQRTFSRFEKGIARFDSYGFPDHSMWCGFRVLYNDFPLPPAEYIGSIPLSDFNVTVSQWLDRRALPLRPIWPGFAINTFLYATILWLLFAAPGRVRRWRRSQRGLCAKCAYPVGACDVCTECGAPVRPAGATECSHG